MSARHRLHRFMVWLVMMAVLIATVPAMAQVAPVPLTLPNINIGGGGTVQAVVRQADGGVVFGGFFSQVNGVPRGHIARLLPNGELDMAFNPAADALVSSLAVDSSGAIFVGGRFGVVGGLARLRVAKLSSAGVVDPNWSAGVAYNDGSSSAVNALAVDGLGGVYVGGTFSHASGVARPNLVKFSGSTGAVDVSWSPSPNGPVTSLALASDGSVYVGGGYSSISGQQRNNVAKVSGSAAGAADTSWNPNANDRVRSLVVDSSGSVYIAGVFATVGGLSRNYIAKLAGSGAGTVDANWNPNANDQIYALAVDGGSIYAGGAFTSIGGQQRSRIAKLTSSGNGSADIAWNPAPDSEIRALTVASDGTVSAGGLFSQIGGVERARFAALPRDVIWRTLTYTAAANGTISGTSPQTVADRGNGSAVTAVANAGYYFVQWSDGSTANPRTDTNVTANLSVTASFATSFVVTATAGANGSITPATRSVIPGATTTFTVTPASGFAAGVSGCGGSLSGTTYTTAAITANCAVTASFTQITYTVTATAGSNGAITPASRTVNSGATTSFTVTPTVGYSASASGCAGSLSGTTYTTAPITSNCTVTAAFAINVYSLNYAAAANGVIIGTAAQNVPHGSNGTAVMASPNAGHQFVQWSDGSTSNPRTDSNVTASINVTASFSASAPSLSLTIDAGRDYARYGQVLSYAISLTNTGSTTLNPASIALSLPEQLDASATTWTCINSGGGAQCAASGSGAVQDNSVVLPAGRSLTWLVTTPVRTNASGGDIVTTVTASSGAITGNGSDRVVLVLMRNGFDANGDGAQGSGHGNAAPCWFAPMPSMSAVNPSATIDDTWLSTVNVPTSFARLFDTLMAGRDDDGAGFRIERANLFPGAQVQLISIAADGTETASAWARVESGAALVLTVAAASDGTRQWWLDGAETTLAAPLSTLSLGRLQMAAQTDDGCD